MKRHLIVMLVVCIRIWFRQAESSSPTFCYVELWANEWNDLEFADKNLFPVWTCRFQRTIKSSSDIARMMELFDENSMLVQIWLSKATLRNHVSQIRKKKVQRFQQKPPKQFQIPGWKFGLFKVHTVSVGNSSNSFTWMWHQFHCIREKKTGWWSDKWLLE